MWIHNRFIAGAIDQETRCTHYNSEVDRVAIQFYCCKKYFPCYHCHKEHGCGETQPWPKSQFHEKAILCGSCGAEQTIDSYLKNGQACPHCLRSFNPGCKKHEVYYFSIDE